VEELEQGRAVALHSTSHLPLSWRDNANLDWSWAFVLLPLEDGRRTRFLFRSRWVTGPLVVHFGWVAGHRSGRFRDGPRHAEWCKAAVRSTRAAAFHQPEEPPELAGCWPIRTQSASPLGSASIRTLSTLGV
jgi:hypothetical protein